MSTRYLKALALICVVAIVLTSACTRSKSSKLGAGSGESALITIKGSDTMVHLVTAWAEAYMKANPKAQIGVTGGGSGTGIAAVINGTTNLCMASREVKDRERKLGAERGVSFTEIAVARDGIAVIVHGDNPVSELTLDQLRQVFNGTLNNWNQVGGPDQKIQALSRESNSGTYVFFNEHVLKKDDYGREVRLMPSNAAIVQSVRQDAWSLGYVGLGYAKGQDIKVVGVKAEASSPAIVPTLVSIRDGSYAIARPLFLYANGEVSGTTKRFVDFILAEAGQDIVVETGYVPVR